MSFLTHIQLPVICNNTDEYLSEHLLYRCLSSHRSSSLSSVTKQMSIYLNIYCTDVSPSHRSSSLSSVTRQMSIYVNIYCTDVSPSHRSSSLSSVTRQIEYLSEHLLYGCDVTLPHTSPAPCHLQQNRFSKK